MRTQDEINYLAIRAKAARIVSSVHGVVDQAMADEIDRLESAIGIERAEELQESV